MELYLSTRRDEAATANEDSGSPVAQRRHVLNELLTPLSLQAAVDAHDVVVLPKGFYRLSRPLLLRRRGGALVGVGRTLSVLMPPSAAPGLGEVALVQVEAEGVTVAMLSMDAACRLHHT